MGGVGCGLGWWWGVLPLTARGSGQVGMGCDLLKGEPCSARTSVRMVGQFAEWGDENDMEVAIKQSHSHRCAPIGTQRAELVVGLPLNHLKVIW